MPTVLEFRSADAHPIDYELDGKYARLPTVYKAFTAIIDGKTVSFERLERGPAQASRTETPPILLTATKPVATISVSEATLSPALNAARDQLAELYKDLPATELKSKRLELIALRSRLDQIDAQLAKRRVILRVSFPPVSADFHPPAQLVNALIPYATSAERINLFGHTDSRIAGLDDATIALSRALEARKFLVSHGVNPERIYVYSQAAGDFIAPNWTRAGRAANRRVDIDLAPPRPVRDGAGQAEL